MSKTITLTVAVAGAALFVTANGLRVGTKGLVQKAPAAVGAVLSKLSKSDARKVRKALAANGHKNLAAVPRTNNLPITVAA